MSLVQRQNLPLPGFLGDQTFFDAIRALTHYLVLPAGIT
jgi:hypothetical protein